MYLTVIPSCSCSPRMSLMAQELEETVASALTTALSGYSITSEDADGNMSE